MNKWERKASTEGGPRQHNGVIKSTVGEPVRKQWQASIKDTIQWLPFLNIMEHNAKKTKNKNGLISSLLKVFAMLEIR